MDWRVGFLFLATLAACEKPKFTEPFVLTDGTEISPEVLEKGRTAYDLYCRACHGEKGDGHGPAALGLRPPPRDFRSGLFKFGAVVAGELPSDDDLRRIIRGGLAGTAMLPWELPDEDVDAVIQYIKTFKKVNEEKSRWQVDPVGKPIIPSLDPFSARSDNERSAIQKRREDPSYQPQGKEEEEALAREEAALLRGEKVYHVVAQCVSCHPSYATRQKINEYNREMRGSCLTPGGFRGYAAGNDLEMYFPDPRQSDYRYPPDPKEVDLLVKYSIPKLLEELPSLADPEDLGARYDMIDAFLEKLSPNTKEVLAYIRANPTLGAEGKPNALRKQELSYLRQRITDMLEADGILYLTPPDFTFHSIRSGITYPDLYRTIAAGLGGTPMPAWHDSLPEEDIWAMVHYVSYLADLKERPAQLAALKKTLQTQPEYTMPSDCNKPATQPTSTPESTPASTPTSAP